ncbi:transposase [Aneurinibacillus thermoaerophilus]|uniref:Transposase n=2 Tax=Aneurinibacillus thermoaerophilus TaxID=143495 RepID=A0ABX8Y6E7_ANETH|nr:IS3 family transposase [Aneurinibacillus thermoaerophilus]QYY41251.1 transposase [Aneurinibacillus thermoaerophilus]
MEPVKSEGRAIPGYSLKQDGTKVSDEQIKEWLMEGMEGEAYAYGYRKLTVFLRRTYGLCINKKKVYRLCKEMDILRPQRQKRDSYSKKLARNRIITGSNQLFERDKYCSTAPLHNSIGEKGLSFAKWDEIIPSWTSS